MGYSDPPGEFFWLALGGVLVSLVSAAVFLRTGWTTAVCLAAVGLVVAVIAGIAVIPAITDQTIYGGVRCPNCGSGQKTRPWSM
jgi:hypothetical protein